MSQYFGFLLREKPLFWIEDKTVAYLSAPKCGDLQVGPSYGFVGYGVAEGDDPLLG
jgi:hypothetical protein